MFLAEGKYEEMSSTLYAVQNVTVLFYPYFQLSIPQLFLYSDKKQLIVSSSLSSSSSFVLSLLSFQTSTAPPLSYINSIVINIIIIVITIIIIIILLLLLLVVVAVVVVVVLLFSTTPPWSGRGWEASGRPVSPGTVCGNESVSRPWSRRRTGRWCGNGRGGSCKTRPLQRRGEIIIIII